MGEFDFIATYLSPLAGTEGLDLRDDAALYQPPAGYDLVLTKDVMVEGVHFPQGHYGGDTSEKLLRVNLSDLAAKGARPVGYLLSIAWPQYTSIQDFAAGFCAGLKNVQHAYDFKLFGGDTVSIDGPMVVSATLLGLVPHGKMVTRSGANIGDDVWITGTIGDAYLGLQTLLGEPMTPVPTGEALWMWEEAYYRPEPRLLLRKVLREFATACSDISDGVISDIGHIATASQVGIDIKLDAIPLSSHTQSWVQGKGETARLDLASAGDDYELGFTASPENQTNLLARANALGLQITKIGRVCAPIAGQNLTRVLNAGGQPISVTHTGFSHLS